MIRALRAGGVSAHVITPRGNVGELLRREGIRVTECSGISKFDNTEYGYYRGRRWLILLREVFYAFPTLLAMIRAKTKQPSFDLVHANDITAIPSIVFAKLIFRKPLILHVRSVQQARKTPHRTSLIGYLVRRFCNAVIAIDETVKQSLPQGIEAQIIHNGFSVACKDRAEVPDTLPFRPRSDDGIRIAMVGQLHAMKGVYDFFEAAKLCKERGIKAKFILVGEVSRDLSGPWGALLDRLGFARKVRADAEKFVVQHKLEDMVLLVGFTPNIRAVYRNIDIICFPSHLNAVGRPVFEAAFFGVPSIVAVTNPRSDTFIDRETGLRINPRDPLALADAVQYYCSYPREIKRMGEAARRLAAEHFSIEHTASRILETYEEVLNRKHS